MLIICSLLCITCLLILITLYYEVYKPTCNARNAAHTGARLPAAGSHWDDAIEFPCAEGNGLTFIETVQRSASLVCRASRSLRTLLSRLTSVPTNPAWQ